MSSRRKRTLRLSIVLAIFGLFALAAAAQAQVCARTLPISNDQYYLRGLSQINFDPLDIVDPAMVSAFMGGVDIWNQACPTSPHIPHFTVAPNLGSGVNIQYDYAPMQWDPQARAWSPAKWVPQDNTFVFKVFCGTPPPGVQQFAYCNGDRINWGHPDAATFVAHEIGHPLGLEHDFCPNGLMNETYTGPASSYSVHPDNCTLANFFNCDPSVSTCPVDPRGLTSAEVTASGLEIPERLIVEFNLLQLGGGSIRDAAQFNNGDDTKVFQNINLLKIGDSFTTNTTEIQFPAGKECSVTPEFGVISASDITQDRFRLEAKCCAGTPLVGGCSDGYSVSGAINLLAPGASISLGLTAVPPAGSNEVPITDTAGPFSGSSSFSFSADVPDGWSWSAVATDVPSNIQCVGFNNSGTISGQNASGVTFTCTSLNGFGPIGPFLPENIPAALDPWSRLAGAGGLLPWDIPTEPAGGGDGCTTESVCVIEQDGTQTCTVQEICPDGVYAAPDTTLLQPTAGQAVSGVIPITGTVWDADGVLDLLFYVDHQPVAVSNLVIGPNFSAQLDTAGLPAGSRMLQILAFDDRPSKGMVTILEQPITVGGSSFGPEIDVFLNWNSQPIPDGGVYQMGQSTPPGVTISRRFRIENNGGSTLTIQNPAGLVNDPCFSLREPVDPTVPVDGQRFFWLDLNCPVGGTYETTVTILSNDTDESPYTFLVRGFIDQPPPEIRVMIDGHSPAAGEVDGGSFTFPSVILPWADPQVETFSICNDGTSPLWLDNPDDLIDRTTMVPFWIQTPPPSSVAAGTCVSFDVMFVTTFGGSYSAHMSIRNNDPNEDPFDLYLHGSAGL